MAKEKLNWEDEQVRHTYRHTASHIMAQAIQHLWPDTKFAIGPAIENGFYYDMESEHKFAEEDFASGLNLLRDTAHRILEGGKLPISQEDVELFLQKAYWAIERAANYHREAFWDRDLQVIAADIKMTGLKIIRKYDDRGDAVVGNIERFAFYDEAKTAYCIISTSEKALYANVMLQKGVVINN